MNINSTDKILWLSEKKKPNTLVLCRSISKEMEQVKKQVFYMDDILQMDGGPGTMAGGSQIPRATVKMTNGVNGKPGGL
jgi:hypothetical protein